MAHRPTVGDALPTLAKGPVTRQMLVEWCAAENDYFPLHYDERLAAQMQLPGTPVQGTFRYALIGQMIARWMGQVGGGRLIRMAVAYRGLDLEGDTITACGRITGCETTHNAFVVGLDVWIENSGRDSSTRGSATVTLSREPDA